MRFAAVMGATTEVPEEQLDRAWEPEQFRLHVLNELSDRLARTIREAYGLEVTPLDMKLTEEYDGPRMVIRLRLVWFPAKSELWHWERVTVPVRDSVTTEERWSRVNPELYTFPEGLDTVQVAETRIREMLAEYGIGDRPVERTVFHRRGISAESGNWVWFDRW